MKGKYLVLLIVFFVFNVTFSQQLVLRKGVILDSISVSDSIQESFSLYLPRKFENKGKWPILFVFDTEGKGRQALGMFKQVAEKENYILAASNDISDSLAISKNVLITQRMITKISNVLPIDSSRVYTAGFENGGRLANIMPIFFKSIQGVISAGAALANVELLSAKNPFHFIGIVGREDYNFSTLLGEEKILDRLKFPNNLIVFDGGNEWPSRRELHKAVQLFTLAAIAKGDAPKDSLYVANAYKEEVRQINQLKKDKKLLLADRAISETLSVYRTFLDTDSIKAVRKALRKDKLFRSLKRNENAIFLKEELLKEDYIYYLEEDLYTYNYNNLGWWNFQIDELNKYTNATNKAERQMGKRLRGYLNALIEDNIEIIESEELIDDEALILLSMQKTITEPENFEYYLKVISLSSKYEDYGTALFYLEEAFMKGFKDTEKLDELPNTAILRISPEYNKLVHKYLDNARYRITD